MALTESPSTAETLQQLLQPPLGSEVTFTWQAEKTIPKPLPATEADIWEAQQAKWMPLLLLAVLFILLLGYRLQQRQAQMRTSDRKKPTPISIPSLSKLAQTASPEEFYTGAHTLLRTRLKESHELALPLDGRVAMLFRKSKLATNVDLLLQNASAARFGHKEVTREALAADRKTLRQAIALIKTKRL